MTKLQKMLQIRNLLNELIASQELRVFNEKNRYEQKVARGQCTAANSCKDKLVPGYKMCSKHLHRAAAATTKRWREKHSKNFKGRF